MMAAHKTLPPLTGAPRICWRRRNSQLAEKTQQRRKIQALEEDEESFPRIGNGFRW